MAFKNIVFDVGNVLVRWDPLYILKQTFPDRDNLAALREDIFYHQTWKELNRGVLSEAEAINEYHTRLNLPLQDLARMLDNAQASLTPVDGSIELLKQVVAANYPAYALTDNTHRFVAYLKNKYDFWPLFTGTVVSAEVKLLKPSPEIYQHLLDQYQLHAHETVFIDDHLPNVEGAKAMGIEAIQFEHIEQCKAALKQLNLTF